MPRASRKVVDVEVTETEQSEAPVIDMVQRLKSAATEEREVRDVDTERPTNEAAASSWTIAAPMQYLQCRLYGHAWTGGLGELFRLDRWSIGQSLECARCHMRRVDVYRRGEYGVAYRRYFPPEGYSLDTQTAEGSRSIPRHLVQDAMHARVEMVKAIPEQVREVYAHWRARNG